MTPAAQAARRALAAHDLDHAESDVYERIAEVADYGFVAFGHFLRPASKAELTDAVATQLDREGLGLEQAPETQAAARDVVAAVQAVTS